MRILLLVLLFSFSTFAQESCEIHSYSQIIKINQVIDDSIIKNSNCNSNITNHFIKLVSNADGKLNNNYLKLYFKNELKTEVNLSPSSINVQTLKDIIIDKFGNKNTVISRVSSLYGKSSFNLDQDQIFELDCNQCNKTGTHNIKFKTSKTTTWISAIFLTKTYAYKVKRSLNNSTPLLIENDFEQVLTTDKGTTRFFNDIENIRFYRLNKDLREGDLLRSFDLTPKNLVSFGQKVKLTIKGQNIKLKSVGIAKRNGKIGDTIEIQNLKTKKTFLGKITGFNKAVVEL